MYGLDGFVLSDLLQRAMDQKGSAGLPPSLEALLCATYEAMKAGISINSR